MGPQQAHEMNMCGAAYGMSGNDFYTFLTRDIEEKESLRQAREQEEEKAMYSVSVAMPYQKHLLQAFPCSALDSVSEEFRCWFFGEKWNGKAFF